MYFPYLFGKRGELIAIRGLSGPLGSPQKIWPVIEPVKTGTGSLVKTLKDLKKVSAGIYLVVNPSQDEFAVSSQDRDDWYTVLAPYVADAALVRPTFLQTAATTLHDLKLFVTANPGRAIGVVLTTNDLAPTAVATALTGTTHVVFLHRAVASASYTAALGSAKTVDIDDNFITQPRNGDYSGTAGQGTNHFSWVTGGKAGFSDYTVLPGTYKDIGGGLMGALVIHLTYEAPTELRVQHFVSATRAQTDPMPTKFYEAIADIETQRAATPARFRLSPALQKYLDQQSTGVYTNAEGNKRQQIAHHLFTVGKVLGL
ncbi:sce7725 family protein [Conyzicola sp.]|uniref:sce7725 family protein n=1 Tax=Conyzicola sp. TaxID=1969404 RepID=UPI00398A1B0D